MLERLAAPALLLRLLRSLNQLILIEERRAATEDLLLKLECIRAGVTLTELKEAKEETPDEREADQSAIAGQSPEDFEREIWLEQEAERKGMRTDREDLEAALTGEGEE